MSKSTLPRIPPLPPHSQPPTLDDAFTDGQPSLARGLVAFVLDDVFGRGRRLWRTLAHRERRRPALDEVDDLLALSLADSGSFFWDRYDDEEAEGTTNEVAGTPPDCQTTSIDPAS